jgi:hypothetical protein
MSKLQSVGSMTRGQVVTLVDQIAQYAGDRAKVARYNSVMSVHTTDGRCIFSAAMVMRDRWHVMAVQGLITSVRGVQQ